MSTRASKVLAALALTVTATLVVGLVGYFAARTPGYANTSVQATQRAAWVTKTDEGAIGLLNQQVNELEAPAFPEGSDFDLLQQQDVVLVFDKSAHTMQSLDTANVVLSGKTMLPETFDLAMSDQAVAVTDADTGDIWVQPTLGLGSGDLTTVAPSGKAAAGAVVTVSGTTATAVAPGSDALVTVRQQEGDGPADAENAAVPGGAFSEPTDEVPEPVSITSVGSTPVVLDVLQNRIVTPEHSFELPEGTRSAILQQPGPDGEAVVVATDRALLRVNLTSGAIQSEQIEEPGEPSAPVFVAGCAHGAWGGASASYLAWCGTDVQVRPIGNAEGSEHLKFRVNSQTVVLNDSVTGNVWVLDKNLTLVNNWDEILVEKTNTGSGNASGEGKSDKTTKKKENCSLKSSATPPNPKADKYGVRSDHPRTLRVLGNDLLSNCSVSVITEVSGTGVIGDVLAGNEPKDPKAPADDPSSSRATIVDGGGAIQFTPGTGLNSPVTLQYTVSDGQGHEASAEVTVNPVPDDEQSPPEGEESTTAVVVGGTVTEEVLSDWDSPSGDQLYLTKAESSVPDDKVTFTAAGEITFVDAGTTGPTKKTVTYSLSDGTHTRKGKLVVNVEEAGEAEPLASPVYASGVVDTPIRIEPLESVFWPGDEELTLTEVKRSRNSAGGLTVATDGDPNAPTVSASEPGTYYLDYHVTAGEAEGAGVIRVDVSEVPEQVPAPVLGTDVAYLPAGGETLVDLTDNDIDASGGIVAVQQISAGNSGLQIQMSDMHLARISAQRPLPPGGVWVKYTASAGGDSATGWLHVIGIPQQEQALAPTAEPIKLSVRAGDALTIPVAKHATDPIGSLLTPVPFGEDAIESGAGLLFTTAESIRYLAPSTGTVSKGKTVRTQYTVVNPAGKKASANLEITVVPTGDNSDPMTPPDVQSRVFAGGTVDLDLPLEAIDPDGDWTILSALDEPPSKGSAVASGTSSLRYTAFDQPGVDTMTYTAVDPFGGTVTGTARVLVVPLPKSAEPPVAPDLKVSVAPGRRIAVNVLAEASDPAGLPVSFADKPLKFAPNSGIKPEVVDGALVIQAGEQEKEASVRYTVQNSRKREATGTVTVKVSKKAPKLPPKAKDVLVTESMLNAKGSAAVVDVSPWVANPGGMPGDLVAGVPAVSEGVLKAEGKRTLQVPITEHRQVIAYQVTNADKLVARAFLIVPSREDLNIDPPPAAGGQAAPENPDPPKETQQSTKAQPSTAAAKPTKPTKKPKRTTSKPPEPEVFKPDVLKSLEVNAGEEVPIVVAEYIGGLKEGRTLQLPEDATYEATQGQLTRADAQTLIWQVPEEAGGRAGLNITVSDGVAEPRLVPLTATIIPKQPDPPTILDSRLDVESGKSAEIDLMTLVDYSDPSKLSFDGPDGGGDGISAELRGTTLVVSAATAAAKGATASVTVTVSDGINEPVTGTYAVTVTGSTEPLATVQSPEVEALAGQATNVNVLKDSVNPFPDAGPLRLLHVDEGESYQRTIDADGTIVVTPRVDFSGKLTVPFVVGDASGDTERNVSGTLTVIVKGKPSAPGTPRKMEVGNQSATIQFEEPADNGAPISSYTVKGTNFEQDCPGSPCTLKNLTNDVTYTFTVIAHNEVGESEPSNPSAGIRPDTAPEAPTTPEVTFGDQTAEVGWGAPENNGSPLTGYQLNISPAPEQGKASRKLPPETTSLTVEGLENGKKYVMTVQALNDSGTPSDPSPGASVIPAGAPGEPVNLTVSSADAAGAAKKIDVSWDAGTPNGDAPGYLLTWTAGGEQAGSQDIAADETSASIPAELGVAYTVSVKSKNKAGESKTVTSKEVIPFTTPGAPEALEAAATGENQVVTLTWPAAADNGKPVVKYQYNNGTDGWQDTGGGGDQTSFAPPGLTNGETYSFQIRACQEDGNCGKPSPAAEAIPYGPPGAPTNVTANPDSAPGTIVLAWQAAGGNGRPVAGYQYRQDGGNWQDAGNVTTLTFDGLKNGQAYTYEVRAYHAEEQEKGKFGVPAAAPAATPYTVPPAREALSAKATGKSGQVELTWKNTGNGGSTITGYQVTVVNGGRKIDLNTGGPANSAMVEVANGEDRAFVIRAINKRGQSADSNTSNTVHTYGPVPKVEKLRVKERFEKSVTFAWDPPPSNGIGGYTYRVNGNDHGKKQSINIDADCGGEEVTATVVAIDSDGNVGEKSSVTGKTKACPRSPKAKIWGWKSAEGHTGSSPGSERCDGSSCIFIAVAVEDFKPNSSGTCTWNLGTSLTRSRDFTTDGNGNWSEKTKTYSGYRPLTVTCSAGGETKSGTLN